MKAIVGTRSLAPPVAAAFAQCKQHIVHAMAFSAFLNVLLIAPALYMMQVYDRVIPTRGGTTLFWLTGIFLFAIVSLSGLDWVRAKILGRASARLERLLSEQILSALLALPNRVRSRSGSALREFDAFRQLLTAPATVGLFDVPWSPIYIGVCFLLHPLIGMFALFCSLALLAIGYFNERAIAPPMLAAIAAQQQSYAAMDTTLRASGLVRALGMKPGLVARHMREHSVSTVLQQNAAFAGAKFASAVKGVRIGMQSLMLGLGALLAINEQISAGAIFASSLLLSRALAPLESVAAVWRNAVHARASLNMLNDLFESAPSRETKTRLPQPVGAIQIEGLTVEGSEPGSAILHQIDISMSPGETVGIVGPSGAGKSTFLRAVAGEIDPVSGAVRLDGAALQDWPEDQRTAAFGYVPQTPTLLPGTVKDNISRFMTETAAEIASVDVEVIRVAKLCGIHEFILRLPKAYDTLLSPDSGILSVGQAQRLAFARALFGSPSVVLLDEPNAHLDADGESQLIDLLRDLKQQNVTVVIAAHSVRVLESSDRLVFLRNGSIEKCVRTRDVIRRSALLPIGIHAVGRKDLAA